ncbi:MAG: hypothetical protein NTV51_19855, partial [Verrucomicrobia bacterium]|nr:hypothetical protein [Verrucomicrobiota bacterium]
MAAAAIPLVLQRSRSTELHILQEIGRQQSAELLARRTASATETAAAGVHEAATRHTRDEIARLQREIAQLREQRAAAETRKRFRDLADPAIAAAYGLKPADPKPLPAGSIPLGELTDLGRASPEALLQTTHWALLHADLDRLARLASFDADSRAALDGWFAELPSTEQATFGTADRL